MYDFVVDGLKTALTNETDTLFFTRSRRDAGE